MKVKSILQKYFNQKDLAQAAVRINETSGQIATPPAQGKSPNQSPDITMDKILEVYARKDLAWKLGINL